MNRFYELLELKRKFDLVGEAKGNEKQTVISNFKEDKLFVDSLEFVFNPFVVTGLSKKKINKSLSSTPIDSNKINILFMFSYLKENKTGSDAVISYVQSWIAQHPEELHEFLKGVFTKDIQIGVSGKTINKALGFTLIPEYGVQLAKKFEDHAHKLKNNFVVTLKLDGIRATVFKDDTGNVSIFTRKGLPIEGLIELEEVFKRLPNGTVLDGELLHNAKGISSDILFRMTQKIVRKDGDKRGIKFVAFDTLPLREFNKGKSSKTYHERLNFLIHLVKGISSDLLENVPMYYIGNDQSRIFEILDDVIQKGYEGLMVNDTEAHYVTKRSDGLLKVKQMYTVDLRVKGMTEHSKKPNTLGALIVDYKGHEVNVGSGFNDAQRALFWNDKENIIGSIVEVQYFEESSNQSGGISLRFPVFKELRWDKNEVSYN